MTTPDHEKTFQLSTLQKVLLMILGLIFFMGAKLATYGPIYGRSIIMNYGKDTQGTIVNKFKGGHLALGLEIRFQADTVQLHSYWVDPLDFQKAAVGESVELKYLELRPSYFAIKKYTQYSRHESLPATIAFFTFASVCLLWGGQIGVLIQQISKSLKINLRIVQWVAALLVLILFFCL